MTSPAMILSVQHSSAMETNLEREPAAEEETQREKVTVKQMKSPV
jgi:hypothetical protein